MRPTILRLFDYVIMYHAMPASPSRTAPALWLCLVACSCSHVVSPCARRGIPALCTWPIVGWMSITKHLMTTHRFDACTSSDGCAGVLSVCSSLAVITEAAATAHGRVTGCMVQQRPRLVGSWLWSAAGTDRSELSCTQASLTHEESGDAL